MNICGIGGCYELEVLWVVTIFRVSHSSSQQLGKIRILTGSFLTSLLRMKSVCFCVLNYEVIFISRIPSFMAKIIQSWVWTSEKGANLALSETFRNSQKLSQSLQKVRSPFCRRQDSGGSSALHLAAQRGHVPLLQRLLEVPETTGDAKIQGPKGPRGFEWYFGLVLWGERTIVIWFKMA